MKVKINDLLVNRSSLTRKLGIAGISVKHMPTHVPAFECCLDDARSFVKRFDSLAYNSILEEGEVKGDYDVSKKLVELIKSIQKEGVRKPVTGYLLEDKVELFGGHHRATVAYALGVKEIEVNLITMDAIESLSPGILQRVRSVYDKVPEKENLREGHSYNYFPGMCSIRKSIDRLKLIYQEIIDCLGNNLVDLGCNDGFFGVALSQHDFDVTFVDRSQVYLDVVQAKMKALENDCVIICKDVEEFIFDKSFSPDVVVYMDVFYHTLMEHGLETARIHLRQILNRTKNTVIFSPGRWDRLEERGFTQKMMFNLISSLSCQIKYLGRDCDKGYRREIYSINL